MDSFVIFSVIVLIFSVVLHEVAHGYAAEGLGDPTARLSGRLTLNPFSHLDLMGSFVVPVLLALIPGGIVFGWAKPVPYNPYNIRNQRWGEVWIAFAGPLTNLVIALIFGFVLRFATELGLNQASFDLVSLIVLINIILAVFNLVPVPPLDGSKILFAILGPNGRGFRAFLEQNWLFVILIFIFFLWQFLTPIIFGLFSLFTGISFS